MRDMRKEGVPDVRGIVGGRWSRNYWWMMESFTRLAWSPGHRGVPARVFTRISSYLDYIVDKSTLIQTSLFQGEGAEDNLVYAGELGNYVFCGTNRSSTLWVDFENLSRPTFVLTVGAFSSLKLTGGLVWMRCRFN